MGEVKRADSPITLIVDNHDKVKMVGHYHEVGDRHCRVDLVKREQRSLHCLANLAEHWP